MDDTELILCLWVRMLQFQAWLFSEFPHFMREEGHPHPSPSLLSLRNRPEVIGHPFEYAMPS